ncbi:hypothetical protein LZQ00_12340 [Sphingobacterium sp. SRCM116780]|uniref:hypothetical protein n=1 Tax=Sphingobacterium sp. SRCM116780 TaxID=2907623 RepID=UPI001F468492|nr:hypothetical protein [Sphingobacterium sp. SRCM116780]UIR55068.1 hypothetical protein LZQ00_12340 [Sphingobacterium sp. SRCM116780]
MRNFKEVLRLEPDLVNFLQKEEYFEKPYHGLKDNFLIITDPKVADAYFNNITDAGDWEDIQNSGDWDIDDVPSTEFDSENLKYVSDNFLSKNKKYHNANDAAENLQDNMISDFCRMFDFCCMEMDAPPIWKTIRYVYLHSGWPCGWDGDYPNGRMVIFSNEVNLK